MARKLNTYVHAVERDAQGNTTRSQVFGPDDTVEPWAVKAITNPDVWEGDDSDDEADEVKEPPRRGPGSGQDAWLKFAASKGVTETFDSKDALITHLEDNGHIQKVS